MKIGTILFSLALAASLTPLTAYIYKQGRDSEFAQTLFADTPSTANNNKSSTVPHAKTPDSSLDKIIDEINTEIIFPETKNSLSPLGVNTNELYEQDASVPFVDLFRVATPFHENIRCRAKDKPCLTDASVEYDKQGWPKRLNGGKAGAFFIRNVSRDAFPKGEFSVLYDGEGKIEYLHNAELVSRKPGEDTIKLTARSDGFMTAALQIVDSNPAKPLRNIRILLPGGICKDDPFHQVADASACKEGEFFSFKKYYKQILFNPDYLNFMKDFSVIRFMPMSGITRNPTQHWDQRFKMDQATWGGNYGSRGAPLEIQIELANRLKADPWLNVPHAADDDYIKQFATYVRDHLAPGLTPHIEYTNEAWNVNFIHNEYAQKMGIAQGLDKDALMAGYKYYAKRAVEFFNIWEKVYGGHDKFVRIISGWDTRPDISGIILAYKDTYKSTDALAIAPYVGGNVRGFRESENVDDIFKLLNDEKSYRSLPKVIEEIKKTAKLAKEFGVEMIAYEGGQGLVDWATRDYMQHPNPLFFAANRDARMEKLYLKLYNEWRDMGAGLFVTFSAPRSCNAHGCWGLKEHIRKPLDESPKLKASLEFIADNKKWWDWDKIRNAKKPAHSKIDHYLPKPDPDKPRIVIRPAKGDSKHFHRLENPQALHILLQGETWDKRDISGKWQVKWDKDNIYLIAKIYDKDAMSDSDDPTQDDSVEFFLYDPEKENNFHFIYRRGENKKDNKGLPATETGLHGIVASDSAKGSGIELPYEIDNKYDGYEVKATIKWSQLGIEPAVKKKLRMEVIVNDDDDGGKRDARLAWNTRNVDPKPIDYGMVLMSGR